MALSERTPSFILPYRNKFGTGKGRKLNLSPRGDDRGVTPYITQITLDLKLRANY
jgi:hypothetical protein